MAYEINYEDQRFKDVEAEKQAALTENQETYDNMIKETEDFYKTQAGAVKEFGNQQSQLQQQQTDFAIEKIEQQREQAHKDYLKEQSAAYVDYQKQIDPHGVNAEQMASMGMQNTGYSESSKVAMYTAYQNRVATAREANKMAELNYDNMMKEAQLQNSSALAEIAFNTYQQEVELLMQGMNYKNQLLLDKANKKMEIDNIYENRWQNVLAQMNHENSLAEQIRQYNESMAEERRQFNAKQSASYFSDYVYLDDDSGDSIADDSSQTVDMDSVIELGYGPISAQRLNELVSSGEVIEYEENGKLKYKKNTSTSKSDTMKNVSSNLPASMQMKLGFM